MKSEVIARYFLVAFLLVSIFLVNVGFSSTRSIDRSDTCYSLTASNSLVTFSIEPSQKIVAVGQTFTVDAYVSDVTELYSYEFKLTYNANVVNLTGPPKTAIPQAGTFLAPSGAANYFIPVWTLNETSSYAPPNQTAHVGYTLLYPELGRNGSGVLVTFTFRALGEGSTLLDLNDDTIANSTANSIPHSSLDSLITVSPQLSVTILPASALMDVGQSQLFGSTVLGVAPPFTYQWYLNDAPVSGGTNPTWTFVPASAGSYNVYLNVTDNVGVKAKSNIALITVNPALSVTISPTSVAMNVNQSQLFTSSATNGTPPYAYKWYLNDTLVSDATFSTWVFTPTTIGTYYVYLDVADSVNSTAQSDAAQITVLSNPVNHDIALEAITNSKSGCKPLPAIGQNGTLQISVTAHNLGDSSESFNVIVCANATEIQRIAIIDLAPSATTTLACNWSTVGFLKGNYVINAYAEPVTDETNTTDNSITGETVAVVIQGDINADGAVNILDMVRIAIKVGMTYPNVNWDPNADVNSDGKINILDIVVVGIHYGETS